ncbi:MAG: hypothetical protein OEZ36_00170 [Spirochaetota bacterium]|nr:hypothetical protein [Spirochaetota bacterium]
MITKQHTRQKQAMTDWKGELRVRNRQKQGMEHISICMADYISDLARRLNNETY